MEPIASTIENFILRERGLNRAVISFDPNVRPFMIRDRDAYMGRFAQWVSASTIIKISSEDSAFLYPGLDPEQALRKMLAMGPKLAVCTLGHQGAVAILRRDDGIECLAHVPAVRVPAIVDTVGAGDTFHGALLSWLELRGKMSLAALANLAKTDMCNALGFANTAAAIVCSRRGADPPALKEVETFNLS
jgi:fructokinase